MTLPQLHFPTPTRVILVRHGRSTYNEQGRYQGASDESVLTEAGRLTAFQTGLALRDLPLAALYTSPLQRTQQTAQEILAALERPLAIVHHPALKEIDLPQWAGLKYREVQETWPAAYQCWMDHPEQFEMMPTQTPGEGIGPAGKPVPDLYAQAQHFWQEVLPQHQGQTIVVVSHGGTIRALVSTALGIPCPYYHTLQQSNCGITTLTFDAAQQAQLEVLNDTSHLGEVLPKLKAGRQGLRLLMVPTSDTSFETLKALQASLEPVNLAFSVSNGKAAQALTQSLLTGHPGAVQLQVDRPDLSQLWLHTLNQRQYPQAADPEIMTGLLVAPAPMLQQMLCHIIGTESTRQDCLPLAAGRVSIVHFPTRQRTPVLQAVNFAGSTPAIGELRSCAS